MGESSLPTLTAQANEAKLLHKLQPRASARDFTENSKA
jgi:hypothetical protein